MEPFARAVRKSFGRNIDSGSADARQRIFIEDNAGARRRRLRRPYSAFYARLRTCKVVLNCGGNDQRQHH